MSDAPGLTPLSAMERRVLGVLLEKSLAQPSYYPMTLNAVVAGCNQKSNRDPVMHLTEDGTWDTLERLRARGLIARLLPGAAGRVERFRHEVKEQFAWEKPQRAIMTELLLRGPQTVGELRGHASRLYPFEDAQAVQAALDQLAGSAPPFVRPLPRAPGRSAVRFAHLLYPPGEAPAEAEEAAPFIERAGANAAVDAAGAEAGPGEASAGDVAALWDAVAELRARLEAVERRLE